MIGTVIVELNLYIGFFERSFTGQLPLHVFDIQTSGNPHRLVIGLDGENVACHFVETIVVVEVFCLENDGQLIVIHHIAGIGKEKVGVGLQMDQAVIDEETAIALHEIGRRETLARVLHLGVGEGEPYLLHLIFREESVDDLNVGAKESDILQSLIEGLSGSCPHAGTLDVDTNKIDVRIALGKSHCVFTLAAPEFEYDGVIVVEILLVPVSLHFKGNVFHYRIRVLDHVLISSHLGKLL